MCIVPLGSAHIEFTQSPASCVLPTHERHERPYAGGWWLAGGTPEPFVLQGGAPAARKSTRWNVFKSKSTKHAPRSGVPFGGV